MTASRPWSRSSRRTGFLLGACAAWGLIAAVPPARAAADAAVVAQDAGTWDLIFEKGNRRCRVNLMKTPADAGYTIGMPAGCRRAFPMLSTVRSWAPGAGEHIVFEAGAELTVLDFGPSGGPGLSAIASENDIYELTPTDQARQTALSVARPDAAAAPPSAPDAGNVTVATTGAVGTATAVVEEPPKLKPATMADVAGHYAVLRQSRDTGCMVTLDDAAKGVKATPKARLAPACRDQGIVIFDPVGWQIVKGQLVLTARRGHTTVLSQKDERTWANAPPKGPALLLKRL